MTTGADAAGGAPPGDVVLVPPNAGWAELFEAERRRLTSRLGDAVAAVHHVGSTAIPGIVAKPVVDIIVLLRRFLGPEEIALVCEAGYEYRGEYGIPGRQYFSRRGLPALHLHAFLEDNAEALRMLRFRDYLRAHPAAARAYEALKRDLADRFPGDRVAYTEGKTAFVREVDALAEAWAATGAGPASA